MIVTAATTPAWTPLFSRAAAVVTDRGTAAAHASLIAREYGIPAVVATGDATRRIPDGSHITVDGGRGVITINSDTPDKAALVHLAQAPHATSEERPAGGVILGVRTCIRYLGTGLPSMHD